MLRGVRGATSVSNNDKSEILEATQELLSVMIEKNNIDIQDIGAIIFSSTPDINDAFPAAAARKLGLTDVPLFGTQEIECPTGVLRCIRVLIFLNTELNQESIKHIYLKDAIVLRPEFKKNN